MASEKQIKANRENARRSTGPRTEAGKKRSSRNAIRHGFSRAAQLDDALLRDVEELKRLLATDVVFAKIEREIATYAFALRRIRSVRAAQIDIMQRLTEEPGLDPRKLKRLAAMDRYDRYARTQCKRASDALREVLQKELDLPERTQS